MKGLSLPQGKKKKSKFILSKRFKEMVTVTNRRVMIYLNGQHTNCQEVISDLKSIEDVSNYINSKEYNPISHRLC